MANKVNEENLNLYQKLAKIRAMAAAVEKSKKGYGYNYADITEILAKITAGMDKYGVSLIPQIVPGSSEVKQNVVVNTKTDKQGNHYDSTTTEMLVEADMVFIWVDNDNPREFIEVPWFLTGAQSDPSQGFGSGLSYVTRYFLTSYFQIAQVDNDVDAYRSKQKEAEASEGKEIAEQIIAQFDTLLKTYLSDHKDKGDEIKKFIGAYIKNSNYLAIKDPEIAGKLLNDFKIKYMEAKEVEEEKTTEGEKEKPKVTKKK